MNRLVQRESVYGWGTHVVEIRRERGRDKWAHVKGPWPLETCMGYVDRMMAREPSCVYRVSDELPRADV